ncbi:MAG: hypothetical protein ACIAZJ_26035 [Gimesia chilikensis]|uniref:hypothetical protein n=1 Tax=Gimesia chilikensis TaxID=2605989 RepID=UPI003790D2C5
MTEDLEKILNTFRLKFQQWYEFTKLFIQSHEKRGVWIDTLSIFYALEKCKPIIGKDNYCRFSNRSLREKDLKTLHERLKSKRELILKTENKQKIKYVEKAGKWSAFQKLIQML